MDRRGRPALATWSLPVDALPAAVVTELPQAVSVATLLTITVGIFALTWSGTLLLQIGSVSLFAGALALFPDDSGFALAAAAVIWLVVTGAGLTRWAVRIGGPDTPAAPQRADLVGDVARRSGPVAGHRQGSVIGKASGP